MRVKRVLCIQDLSCVGRCSLAVAAPILSAMGLQACMLPTALLSTHLGFETPFVQDATAFLAGATAHYAALGEKFDAIYSGYLSNPEQVKLVAQCFVQYPDALKLVDPVMADHGSFYKSVTPAYCAAMTALCAHADVITPNVTESAILCDMAPSSAVMTDEQLEERLVLLQRKFNNAHLIVITGVALANGKHGNACLWPGGQPRFLSFEPVAQNYPGTGDLFASILTGGLLRNGSALVSIRLAADFIETVTAETFANEGDPRFGVWFEPFLKKLMP